MTPVISVASAFSAFPSFEVFSVEDSAIQVVWHSLPAPHVSLEIGDQVRQVVAPPPAVLRRRGRRPAPLRLPPGAMGGPGAVVFDGLAPGTSYDLTVSGPGMPRRLIEKVTTLRPPPGRLLDAFATINDLHLGEPGFGPSHDIEDAWPLPTGRGPYSWRCIDSAIDEAIHWGARALVVKGDMTSDGVAAEFHEIGELLGRVRVPVMATFGNHEFHDLETDGRPILQHYGIHVPREPWARDRDGIRLVFALTPRPGERAGEIDDRQRARLVALAAEAPGPAFVVLHHQPQRWAWPTEYPPGIAGHQAQAFLDELAAANPASFVASGHTHRHRRRRHGPIEVVEVGSTKDYPGTWTGYAVHEGGIRQVVRRIAAPDVIAWTETTARAIGGVWGRWSPGRRDERCFTHHWPARD
ncbi:MAG: 3,5-cyclic-AMP phosphodiesterase [Acidimicrobiaceae bacterium]|nr:3,5-cyclic-AMP phosphodiesterase [Acidimicrobiaceae bacterium]